MNVNPLARNKFSKLAAIVLLLLALSVVIAKPRKKIHVYRFKIENKEG